MSEEVVRERRFPLGAIVLIFLGTVLLFNNFNLLAWSVWDSIWRLWPLLLIVWGVQTIFGRNWITQTGLAVLLFLVLGLFLLVGLSKENSSLNGWMLQRWSGWEQSSSFFSWPPSR